MDGKPLDRAAVPYPPLTKGGPPGGGGMEAETIQAGSVQLTAGIHTLTLRPRRGEDIRADFVILTTDPTIAGYAFGVQPNDR
jgi:hypothetical protein